VALHKKHRFSQIDSFCYGLVICYDNVLFCWNGLMPLTTKHIINTKKGIKEVTITPRKAMRLCCLDCCCWDQIEVRLCTAYRCPIWPYRMGRGEPEKAPDYDEALKDCINYEGKSDIIHRRDDATESGTSQNTDQTNNKPPATS
jgi:hypothetical protein